ncbi:MAG: ATP-binding protein [Lachnoclostridium sp.]|nr:ATP-binding protein [Lachnoclostridium sp.]
MRINRDTYLQKLVRRRHNGMIKVVTGPRRSGKSYLLRHIFEDYLLDQGVQLDHIIKIDFEDRRNVALRNPDNLIAYIDGRMTDSAMYYILLDEIQKVDEFVDVLNSYLEIENADVYVTGSNSRLLSRDVVTEFRGRGDEIEIAPLSFSEFFPTFSGSREDALTEYLTFGGMPKVATMSSDEEKTIYLKSLFRTVYLSDIKERYGIRNDTELEELIKIVASAIGGITNPTKLENTFKSIKNVSLSKNTIASYLKILEDVFILRRSERFDIKGKKYIDASSKYYFLDCGLRNAHLNFRQIEAAHLLENAIYNELVMRGLSVDVGVVNVVERNKDGKLQRKQLEVDFVCNQGSKRYYIQSALRLPTQEKLAQELHSFKNIDDNFQRIVITEDLVKPHRDETGVLFMNIYDFLLDSDSLNQ